MSTRPAESNCEFLSQWNVNSEMYGGNYTLGLSTLIFQYSEVVSVNPESNSFTRFALATAASLSTLVLAPIAAIEGIARFFIFGIGFLCVCLSEEKREYMIGKLICTAVSFIAQGYALTRIWDSFILAVKFPATVEKIDKEYNDGQGRVTEETQEEFLTLLAKMDPVLQRATRDQTYAIAGQLFLL